MSLEPIGITNVPELCNVYDDDSRDDEQNPA